MAVIAIFMSTVGYDFFVSAFSGNFEAPGSSGLGSAGYVYFSSLVASNDLLVTLLALAFMGWFLPACYTQAAMAQRAIMTWSFDGLLPRRLGGREPDPAHAGRRRSSRPRWCRCRWRCGSVTATTSSSTSRSRPSRRTRRWCWWGSPRR